MDSKTYIREIYSKYWISAREKIYGFTEYDKRLCDLVLDCSEKDEGDNGNLLEVAIGTGYPFADFFQRSGYDVSGVDLSDTLVAKCRQLYPNIKVAVGDAEDLGYPDGLFDLTYCFHATWYFPDLPKAVSEMIRVTRAGGHVLFDIQNRNNSMIAAMYEKRLFALKGIGKWMRYAKNVVKTILRRGTPQWQVVDSEVPTFPENVIKHLVETGFKGNVTVYGSDTGVVFERCDDMSTCAKFRRLVFVLCKLGESSRTLC